MTHTAADAGPFRRPDLQVQRHGDWKLAYHSAGEAINDFSVMIALQSVENLVNHPVKAIDDLGWSAEPW